VSLFRLHKPNELGVLHRSYRMEGSYFLVLKTITFFRLSKHQELLEERDGWMRVTNQLGSHQYLDPCMPKGAPEVLLSGSAYSPGGVPLNNLSINLRVESFEKGLEVFGNRIWQKKWLGYKQTEPVEFSAMPLSWEKSYGFSESGDNPNGVGTLSEGNAKEVIVSLPNIYYPGEALNNPTGTVRSAGFGPLQPQWPVRSQYAKPFNFKYMAETFPAMPQELDFRLYNMAPEDQWLVSLKGDEGYELVNLHPDLPLLEGKLPGVRPRFFRTYLGSVCEVSLVPETVWFFPEEDLGVVIHVSNENFGEQDPLKSIGDVLLAYEWLKDTPKDLEYYEHELTKRIDGKSLDAVFNQAALRPAPSKVKIKEVEVKRSEELLQYQKQRQESWETLSTKYSEKSPGFEDSFPSPPPIDPRLVITESQMESGDYSLDSLVSASAEVQEESLRKARDLNETPAPTSQPKGGEANDEQLIEEWIKRIRTIAIQAPGGQVEHPEFDPKSFDGRALYRASLDSRALALEAQVESKKVSELAGKALREEFLQMLSSGEDLSGRDFTGLDASGLDLSRKDFHGSIFECADLTGANFERSNLEGCSFVGADLDQTRFVETNLSATNFSEAKGVETDFTKSKISSKAAFSKLVLVRAYFTGSRITNCIFLGSKLIDCRFSETWLNQCIFNDCQMNVIEANASRVERCIFSTCSLTHCSWITTTFVKCGFTSCAHHFSLFSKVSFESSMFGAACTSTAINFSSSQFIDCGLRGMIGTAARIDRSNFINCDLGDISLTHLTCFDSVFESCQFQNSNFFNAQLARSNFRNCSFESACLDDCDLNIVDFSGSDVLTATFGGSNYLDASGFNEIKSTRLAKALVAG
jgi:uncharacterized protein YjbI with pentapeptide repeats